MATFPEIFNVAIDHTDVPIKLEVRSFTRSCDNRGTQKIWTRDCPWTCPRSLFSDIFNTLLFGCTLWMYRPNLKSATLPVPEIIVIAVLGGVASSQSWGRGVPRRFGMVPFERALVSSHGPSTVTLILSLRVSEILPRLCAPARHFFPANLYSPPNSPMFRWQ